MSDPATKLEQQRSTEGPARRTYASLQQARGFCGLLTTKVLDLLPAHVSSLVRVGEHVVALMPMTERTYWRHVGGGRWDSAGALYEKVEGA